MAVAVTVEVLVDEEDMSVVEGSAAVVVMEVDMVAVGVSVVIKEAEPTLVPNHPILPTPSQTLRPRVAREIPSFMCAT